MAVSGGPDSLALLLLAHAALPGRVVAATIDHGLRPESADEAAFVAGVCAGLGIEHVAVRVAVAPGNLQDRARAARYAALCNAFGARGVFAFATAHHADDQAETMLMRLTRASGLAGLAGIRAWTLLVGEKPLAELQLLRPLLYWRSDELAQVVARAGIEPVRDSSNDDERFDRVRVRRVLAALPDLDPLAIARSAAFLEQAEDVVDEAVAQAAARCVVRDPPRVWLYFGHPRLVEIELVSLVLAEFGAAPPRSAVAQMIDQLRADGHATLGGVMAHRAMHRADSLTQRDAWRFEVEPPRLTG